MNNTGGLTPVLSMLSILPSTRTLFASGLVLILLWKIATSFVSDSDVPSIEMDSGFLFPTRRWLRSYHYVLTAPDILADQYEKAGGRPFAIPIPGNYLFLVSSKKHIQELIETSDSQISLQAVVKDIFKPQYTMFGFDIQEDESATRNVAHRVLRTLLTTNLPNLQPALQMKIKEAFDLEISNATTTDWRAIQSFEMARRTVVKLNSFTFVGEKLSSKQGYLEAAIQYPEDVFITAEVLQITPTFLGPLVASMMTKNGRAVKTLVKYLTLEIKERIKMYSELDGQQGKPLDCLQWIINSSSRKNMWTKEKIIQEFLALWFGSVHQMAMSFVYILYDLCAHPEYIESLRSEAEKRVQNHWVNALENMPLLDSFLKESSRLNPSDAISMRRKVMKPFAFSDGIEIPVGNWACVPQRSMMRDPATYLNPDTFDGFRFVTTGHGQTEAKPERASSSLFTKADIEFPFWGLGSHTCPGRFYASAAIKSMVAHLLLNYDMKFANQNQKRTFSWRTAVVPVSNVELLFRRR